MFRFCSLVFFLFGCLCGAFMISLCACSMAWSSVSVSIASKRIPLLMVVPPMARLIVLLRLGHIDLSFHHVLLILFALHAPSDCMKMFVHWSRIACVLCLW